MASVRRRTRLHLVLAASAIAQSAAAQPEQAQRFDGKLSPCKVASVDEDLRCGQFPTFENRAARTGRRINLKVVVIPATSPDVARDAMVYLAGGGVLPATEYVGFFVRQFAQLRRNRDILLVDQRGTGESNPLPCTPPAPLPGVSPEDAYFESIARCRADLGTKADLRFYSTPLAMDDLDDIRAWLGYEQLTLYGMSYGTKAAQVYMRQYPSRVRAVAMHGVVPLNTSMWIDTPRLGQEALDRVITLCRGQPVCAAAFPQLRSEIDDVIARLAASPVVTEITRPDGQRVTVTVGAPAVREFLYSTMGSAASLRFLPFVMHAAHEGTYEPLAQRVAPALGGRGVPRGVFLSIACAEAIALIDPAAIPAAGAGTFMGEAPIRRLVRTCAGWPRSELPAGFWNPVAADVPVLLLTGELDQTTPPRYAASVGQSLRNSRHLLLPNRSHNDLDDCVSRIIESFLITNDPGRADASCAAGPPIQFATSRQ